MAKGKVPNGQVEASDTLLLGFHIIEFEPQEVCVLGVHVHGGRLTHIQHLHLGVDHLSGHS